MQYIQVIQLQVNRDYKKYIYKNLNDNIKKKMIYTPKLTILFLFNHIKLSKSSSSWNSFMYFYNKSLLGITSTNYYSFSSTKLSAYSYNSTSNLKIAAKPVKLLSFTPLWCKLENT
jgi:hypothetical protein